jgi:hypothetical protein
VFQSTNSGAVFCTACEVTPAVSEIAILLEAMLPLGTRVPGGLRYTIARAFLNVDVRPFDSVQEFSRALARFEHDDRDAVLRTLFERWQTVATSHEHEVAAVIPFKGAPAAVPFKVERRHPIPSAIATELRRELRKADLELYRIRAESTPSDRRAARARTRAFSWIFAGPGCGPGPDRLWRGHASRLFKSRPRDTDATYDDAGSIGIEPIG